MRREVAGVKYSSRALAIPRYLAHHQQPVRDENGKVQHNRKVTSPVDLAGSSVEMGYGNFPMVRQRAIFCHSGPKRSSELAARKLVRRVTPCIPALVKLSPGA